MRKHFYDVIVRSYKKDLRNVFPHFSDLFYFSHDISVYPAEFPCLPTLRESAVPLPHADIY